MSRILDVTNVANHIPIFLNLVQILTIIREKSKVTKIFSLKKEKVASRKCRRYQMSCENALLKVAGI